VWLSRTDGHLRAWLYWSLSDPRHGLPPQSRPRAQVSGTVGAVGGRLQLKGDSAYQRWALADLTLLCKALWLCPPKGAVTHAAWQVPGAGGWQAVPGDDHSSKSCCWAWGRPCPCSSIRLPNCPPFLLPLSPNTVPTCFSPRWALLTIPELRWGRTPGDLRELVLSWGGSRGHPEVPSEAEAGKDW
jgi:hypothetical protein